MTATFTEQRQAAMLAEAQQQQAEFRRVADLVAGNSRTRRVEDVIRIGGDHLVRVVNGDSTHWTTVVADKPTCWYHDTQEQALLHLIACRYDPNPDTSVQAARYAGRVLGIPTND